MPLGGLQRKIGSESNMQNMTETSQKFAGQKAVVTGSSSGIGKAIAEHLAAAGAQVVVHGFRKAQAAEDLANSLGNGSSALLCDLSNEKDRDEFIEKTWLAGPVDIWINNAGADVLTGEAADWSFDQKLHQLWQVDVCATIDLSRKVGARMKQRGSGVILNMGWDQATDGMEGDSGEMFSTIKGAIMAFTKSLAKSLAPKVRVNCLAPGWIKTEWGETASEYWQDRAMDESLLGRWGTPEDVAQAACYLASSDASFITGQILNINGGFRR